MAELTAAQRQAVWKGIQRYWSQFAGIEETVFNSPALWDAVIATDEWIDDNQGSFNAALPTAFRTEATLEQKTMLFCAVAICRAGGLPLLRKVFGEVE